MSMNSFMFNNVTVTRFNISENEITIYNTIIISFSEKLNRGTITLLYLNEFGI